MRLRVGDRVMCPMRVYQRGLPDLYAPPGVVGIVSEIRDHVESYQLRGHRKPTYVVVGKVAVVQFPEFETEININALRLETK